MMAADIDKRLSQLRARRDGSDRYALDSDALSDYVAKLSGNVVQEGWEKRATAANKNTSYAVGAMQSVGATYTRVSIETAERIGKQLMTRLAKESINVEFRLQGSVPLDVHIRRVSDVDLLTIDKDFLVFDPQGIVAMNGGYTSTPKNSLGVLQTLRKHIEVELPLAYPQATVDTSGAKAVKIHGGSLPRVVDVVPAHWYDTVTYQSMKQESDRGIYILDKKAGTSVTNFPFLHIKKISDRCNSVGGCLRKAIRLCKNVKADAESEGTSIALPSFDIAATMYHSDTAHLAVGMYFELAILVETQRFLDVLARNHEYAKTLSVPDESRKIFDINGKLGALNTLSIELDDLLRRVAAEHGFPGASLDECRNAIRYLNG